MTAAQRATLEQMATYNRIHGELAMERGDASSEHFYRQRSDALRAALGTCGSCQHADTDNSGPGWAWCAAEGDYAAFPFIYQHMPLGERCTGYTPKEGA